MNHVHENARVLDVLHVGFGHPPVIGGGPIYYLHHLCRIQETLGLKTACFVAGSARKEGEPEGILLRRDCIDKVSYWIVDNRPARYFDWLHPEREAVNPEVEERFGQVLEDLKPRVVHFHNLVGLCMSLVDVARSHGVATVFSAHNYWMVCPRDDLFSPAEARCEGPRDGARCAACVGAPGETAGFMFRAEQAVRILRHRVGRILAVSRRVKEILVHCGVPEEKIQVQRIGSRAAEENWLRLGAARRLDGQRPAKIRFGFFGTVMVRKGPHLIIEALEYLQRFQGRFEVRIFGAGLSEEYWMRMEKALSRAPDLWDHVSFPGPYTQEDLPSLLREVDAAIIPPIWEDNGPQTVMETLAAGVPVLGSRMGGIPDFVEHERNGLLFEPDDPQALARAMERVMEEEDLLSTLRAGIRPPLGMEQHARELEVVYDEILRQDRRHDVARQRIHALLGLAADALEKGDASAAEDFLKRAVDEDPHSPSCRYHFAALLAARERNEEAIEQLREVLRLDPGRADAHNDLGVLLHARGQRAASLYHLREAVKRGGGQETALQNLAQACLEAGRPQEALETFERLLEKNPGNPEAAEAISSLRRLLARGENPGTGLPVVGQEAGDDEGKMHSADHCEKETGLAALPEGI